MKYSNKEIFHGTAETFKNFKGNLIWFTYKKSTAEAFANSCAGLRVLRKNNIPLPKFTDSCMSRNFINNKYIKNTLKKNNLHATKGRVITRSLSKGKTLDLTNYVPFKINNMSELKKIWKSLQNLDLISESWEDLNDKEKENIKIKYFYFIDSKNYQKLPGWYFLENQDVYSKAKSFGFDYIKINDMDVDGNNVVSIGVCNLNKINNKKFI